MNTSASRWTIGRRIALGFAAVLTFTLVLGLFTYLQLRRIDDAAAQLATESLPGLTNANQIQALAQQNYSLTLRCLLTDDKNTRQSILAQVRSNLVRINDLTNAYARTISQTTDRQLFGAAIEARAQYVTAFTQVAQLSDDNKAKEALDLANQQLLPTYDSFMSRLDALASYNASNCTLETDAIDTSATQTKNATLAGVLGALALAGVVGFLIARRVNQLLTRVATELGEEASQVSSAADQVSASSQSLAEGASQQAASLEETSASLEEMASMTKRNAENAQKASDLAKNARTAADTGATDIQVMSRAMQELKTASDDIGKIIKTIDEIAFQTNILALNAAVEAARAGEAGMGFAVVADEVRNLAQRSAQAAKETAAKIEGAVTKTGQGVQISEKVAHSLQEIVNNVRKVDELIAEVATASKEQSQGIDQVTSAVTQMDQVTQSNASSAEESASAAAELNAQARAMQQAVTDLLHLVGQYGQDPSHAPPALRPAPAQSVQPTSRVARHLRVTPSPVAPPSPPPASSNEPAALVRWDDERMTTGVESVDAQHQELITMINRLHAACLNGTGREELLQLLNFLGHYAQEHFAHEEGVMDDHQCPARGKNKAAHQKFLQDFATIMETFNREGASTTLLLQLKNMVGNWLQSHICNVDTSLRSCTTPCHHN